MKRIRCLIQSLAAAAALVVSTPFGAAVAQVACDDPKIVEHLPANCQKERISASGNQRLTTVWALGSARDHWQDQVLNKYGERYAIWDRAACLREECVPASLSGFRRCTLSGFPCLTRPPLNQLIALSTDEIMEMQRRLNGFGARPQLHEDGKYGPKTTEALERWQRVHGYPVDGLPNRENLERLRKA